ncbi:MAG: DsbA family oxidoreductase [Rubellimicrobium sp.]|nr:DsbA family oxidoreductase [Rubellimicrobium sp.]
MVTLDIFSDPVCPWCLIGKAGLDRALERAGDHPFRVRWLPFMLHPDLPREGVDFGAWLETRFGGRAKAARALTDVEAKAAEAGLSLDLTRIARMPNTMDAHRLIHWAGIDGCQTPVVEALFRAHFSEGRDIGQAEVLADIADGAGMDAAVVLRLLSGDADLDQIREGDRAARAMGVTAVPTFVVAGAHAVPGAQPPELWDRVIAEITAQLGGTAE